MSQLLLPSPLQKLESGFLSKHEIELFIKRDDLIHSEISGNKWRKLKLNLEEARKQKQKTILTFGGAYSNHLVATSFVGKMLGFNTIGVIRGEEPKFKSHSLLNCEENGMTLHFVSRQDYKLKETDDFLESFENKFGSFYSIPEGGANELGSKGCEEIIKEINTSFNYIITSAGTGTTATGILSALKKGERLLVFPALKGGSFLENEILSNQENINKKDQLELFSDYHFGGYAKVNQELIDFTRGFHNVYNVKLDLIYTAKALYGLFDLISKGYFTKKSRIIFLHTGGLQGNRGIESRLGFTLFS